MGFVLLWRRWPWIKTDSRCNGVISNPFAWFLHPVGDRCSPLEIVLGRFVIFGFFIGVVGFIENEPRWIILTLQNIEASVLLFLNWAFVICDAGLFELFDIRRFDFDVNTGHQHGATWLINSSWLRTHGLGWHLHNVEWIYLYLKISAFCCSSFPRLLHKQAELALRCVVPCHAMPCLLILALLDVSA